MPGKDYWKGYNDEKETEKPHDVAQTVSHAFGLHQEYNPPSDPDRKAEYDAGWDRSKKE